MSRESRQDPSSQRFFGVQWQLLYSHVEVALGAALITGLVVGLTLYSRRDFLAAALAGALAAIAVSFGAAVVAFQSSRSVKLRLREASRFASALARGDYRWRILPGPQGGAAGVDEIDQLKEDLNAMADSLEAAIIELRALAERNRRLAEEAGRFAALEERTRLARDLHDTVTQQVFSLSMQSAAARRRLETAGPDPGRLAEVGTLLAEVEELSRSAHRQMRDLVLQLRPTTLEQQGLGPALEEYVRTFAEAEGLGCRSHVECAGRFAPAAEEALFRIAQEALNNVAKHAGAKRVEVSVTLEPPDHVVLTVTDDGRGFDPSAPARATALGLRGLKERAAALGGRVRVSSAPGRGTAVSARFPLDGAQDSGRAGGKSPAG